jgi:hypothetical protein
MERTDAGRAGSGQAPGLPLSGCPWHWSLQLPPSSETDTATSWHVSKSTHVQGPSYELRGVFVPPSCASLPVMTPGPYQAGLWADVRNLNQSSPPFSPLTATSGVTALSFPEPAANCHGDSLWSSTSSFLYESSLVTITLGRRVWSLRQPVYGFNGIVQGAVRLSGKCTHVVRMEVSVETAFIHPPTWSTAD